MTAGAGKVTTKCFWRPKTVVPSRNARLLRLTVTRVFRRISSDSDCAMASFVLSPIFISAFLAAVAYAPPAPYGERLWSNTLDDGSTGDDYERLVDSQIRENPVMLYTGSRCGFSRMCRDLLNTKYPTLRYKYLDYDISPGGDWMMGPVMRRSRTARLPHIFICGRYIGGKSNLFAYHESEGMERSSSQCDVLWTVQRRILLKKMLRKGSCCFAFLTLLSLESSKMYS